MIRELSAAATSQTGSAGVGCQRDEMLVLADDALAGVAFLADDVAENAALFLVVIVPAVVASSRTRRGTIAGRLTGSEDGRCRAGGFPVILENENVSEALSFFRSSMRSR